MKELQDESGGLRKVAKLEIALPIAANEKMEVAPIATVDTETLLNDASEIDSADALCKGAPPDVSLLDDLLAIERKLFEQRNIALDAAARDFLRALVLADVDSKSRLNFLLEFC